MKGSRIENDSRAFMSGKWCYRQLPRRSLVGTRTDAQVAAPPCRVSRRSSGIHKVSMDQQRPHRRLLIPNLQIQEGNIRRSKKAVSSSVK